ncbi:acetyl-CoA carboxylase biotin carboxyl carrier protein [Arthrobacter sp. 2MCAF14]|uniref:acetyl-CoA carboxylase biotin carboxyl carrier protein n=1 Tax=Arthrobacter sp. 2MCAF14 TaxID=3232982 RepID=UPI003F8E93AB
MAENARPSWDDLVQLITEVDGSDFDNVAIEYDDISVRMSRGELPATAVAQLAPAASATSPQLTASKPAHPEPALPAVAPPASSTPAAPHGTAVTSPMMGIFFRSPSPGAPPFVSVGDTVRTDSIIGIIEVMKLMNPVHAGIAGTISAIAVEDAQAVEFGQDLLYIVPEGS